MYFDIVKISALTVAGFAVLLLVISSQIFKLNKKKGFVSLILAFLYAMAAGYYLYLALFGGAPQSLFEQELLKLKQKQNASMEKVYEDDSPAVQEDVFFVVLQAGDKVFEIAEGDDIDIKKNTRLKILEVKTPGKSEQLKADFKGFAGNPRFNDQQDIGYWITYDRVLKHWNVDDKKEKYEVQVISGKEKLGSIFITFVD